MRVFCGCASMFVFIFTRPCACKEAFVLVIHEWDDVWVIRECDVNACVLFECVLFECDECSSSEMMLEWYVDVCYANEKSAVWMRYERERGRERACLMCEWCVMCEWDEWCLNEISNIWMPLCGSWHTFEWGESCMNMWVRWCMSEMIYEWYLTLERDVNECALLSPLCACVCVIWRRWVMNEWHDGYLIFEWDEWDVNECAILSAFSGVCCNFEHVWQDSSEWKWKRCIHTRGMTHFYEWHDTFPGVCYHFVRPSIFLFLSYCLSICRSASICLGMSVFLSVCLSVYLFVCLHLSLCHYLLQ